MIAVEHPEQPNRLGSGLGCVCVENGRPPGGIIQGTGRQHGEANLAFLLSKSAKKDSDPSCRIALFRSIFAHKTPCFGATGEGVSPHSFIYYLSTQVYDITYKNKKEPDS
jgi:hypothetical protein